MSLALNVLYCCRGDIEVWMSSSPAGLPPLHFPVGISPTVQVLLFHCEHVSSFPGPSPRGKTLHSDLQAL
jgi:hypothetical protein